MAVALNPEEVVEDAADTATVIPSSLSFISCTSLLTKSQRLLLGLLVLLCVDFIWVASSELTKVTYCFLPHH